jgi:hypothetical protein
MAYACFIVGLHFKFHLPGLKSMQQIVLNFAPVFNGGPVHKKDLLSKGPGDLG